MDRTEETAKVQLRLGNFRQALDIFSELHKNSSRTEKNHYAEICTVLERHCRENESNYVGRTFFPVYVAAAEQGALRSLVVREHMKDGYLAPSQQKLPHCWDTVTKVVGDILNKTLRKLPNPSCVVLQWGWDCWSYVEPGLPKSLCSLPSVGSSYEPSDGDSKGLALAIALISHVLNVSVDSQNVFSGILTSDGTLSGVEHLPEKIEACRMERPKRRTVFLPKTSSKRMEKHSIKPIDTVEQAVNEIFPNFATVLTSQALSHSLGAHYLYLESTAPGVYILRYKKRMHPDDKTLSQSCIPVIVPQLPQDAMVLTIDGGMPFWLTAHLPTRYVNKFSGALAASLGQSVNAALVIWSRHKHLSEGTLINPLSGSRLH